MQRKLVLSKITPSVFNNSFSFQIKVWGNDKERPDFRTFVSEIYIEKDEDGNLVKVIYDENQKLVSEKTISKVDAISTINSFLGKAMISREYFTPKEKEKLGGGDLLTLEGHQTTTPKRKPAGKLPRLNVRSMF